ncbi:unnamed protein product [Blepharisma stoltei]|uniref:Uncharacterized protein n=1 Tax=Blepharisma stoltei TaxID=1481888 RepID=A0AAU9IF92_9CILI|nr:unnamed protein product [Blepharisma stoltei]
MMNGVQELLVAMAETFIYKAIYNQKLYLLAENTIENSFSSLFSDKACDSLQQSVNQHEINEALASSSQKKHKYKKKKKRFKSGLPLTPRVKYKLLKVKANIVRKRIIVHSFEYVRIVLEQMSYRQNPIVYEL